ncbi:MAG: hypothetical protein H0U75_01805 [Legionella sp.]|nr:hypothetical protein [Legionella sp.]
MGALAGALIVLSGNFDFYSNTPERYEDFSVSRIFPPQLIAHFHEIQQRIQKFQDPNKVIESSETTHPLLAMDENKVKVSFFRKAMKTELTFFNTLNLHMQEREQEEKHSSSMTFD